MNGNVRHKGWLAQTRIYLGKLLRMFVYQNDWKFLPASAVITAAVTYVVGANLFVTQEGTITGAFALVCACIWNGVFNSIQAVCRERSIVKREHRAGLRISAYVAAHMIYQLMLCLCQTVITLVICRMAGVQIPAEGVITPWGLTDLGITILLIIYASDMMGLMISSLVRDTTTAMTVMPFLLIIQLIFSGAFFDLSGFAEKLSLLTVSLWGMNGICAVGRYNDQPMVTLWNTVFKFRNAEFLGYRPLLAIIKKVESLGYRDAFLLWSGTYNRNDAYASTAENLLRNWYGIGAILLFSVAAALISLSFIDRDRR